MTGNHSAKYSIDGERGSSSPGYKTSMTLFIHDFQPEDRSVYICVAANSLGTAEASIQIYGPFPVPYFYTITKTSLSRKDEYLSTCSFVTVFPLCRLMQK